MCVLQAVTEMCVLLAVTEMCVLQAVTEMCVLQEVTEMCVQQAVTEMFVLQAVTEISLCHRPSQTYAIVMFQEGPIQVELCSSRMQALSTCQVNYTDIKRESG